METKELSYKNFEILQYNGYPGFPPDSIWLANLTSEDQMSNCHFLSPITPQSTEPE